MEKAIYNLVLIHENMPLSGGNHKLLGVKEGANIKDWISSKHDKVLGMRGQVEMFGDVNKFRDVINLNDDFELDI